MLKYLIILLDDTSTSYCSYSLKDDVRRNLMSLEVLKKGIVWAMKENLNIQFVYPNYELPVEYKAAIETIDHTKIGPTGCCENLDVIVIDTLTEATDHSYYLWRCTLDELKEQREQVMQTLKCVARLNVVLTDIPKWKDSEFETYQMVLEFFADELVNSYQEGLPVQLNLLTDRPILNCMNNCGAGDENITLAPDGQFYVCPAYYYGNGQCVGSLATGLNIKNPQLFQLAYAPLCRRCDAYQCRRCVWQNEQLTMDCNTPSHEQCVASHLERNASRRFLQRLREKNVRLANTYDIPNINYLDPFNVYNQWK